MVHNEDKIEDVSARFLNFLKNCDLPHQNIYSTDLVDITKKRLNTDSFFIAQQDEFKQDPSKYYDLARVHLILTLTDQLILSSSSPVGRPGQGYGFLSYLFRGHDGEKSYFSNLTSSEGDVELAWRIIKESEKSSKK